MKIFDVIAISIELPEHELNKGQIGTVVEILDDDHVLVEFSSSSGIAQRIISLKK